MLSKKVEKDVPTEDRRNIAGSEHGRRGHGPREASRQALEAGKGKETDSPLEPPERNAALPTR